MYMLLISFALGAVFASLKPYCLEQTKKLTLKKLELIYSPVSLITLPDAGTHAVQIGETYIYQHIKLH